MHELSIALSILEIAAEEAQRRGNAQIAAVHVRLGPLSGVLKHALLSAFDLARQDSPLDACQLVIEDVPVVIFCPICREERDVPSIQEIRCSVCGTLTADIRHGRELLVSAMEICQ